jgi:hypothetical protein
MAVVEVSESVPDTHLCFATKELSIPCCQDRLFDEALLETVAGGVENRSFGRDSRDAVHFVDLVRVEVTWPDAIEAPSPFARAIRRGNRYVDPSGIHVGEIPKGKRRFVGNDTPPAGPQSGFHQLVVRTPRKRRHAVYTVCRVIQAPSLGKFPQLDGWNPCVCGLTRGDVAMLIASDLENPIHDRHVEKRTILVRNYNIDVK